MHRHNLQYYPFLDIYKLPMSSLGRKTSFIVINFLVLRSICWSSSSFISRISSSILQSALLRCWSFWWDSCCSAWFPVVFSFVCDTLLVFFLHLHFVWWRLLPIFLSTCKFTFLEAFWFFLDLPVLFLPLSLFLYQIPFLYTDCIFLFCVYEFPVFLLFFFFLQTAWCRPFT